MLPTRLISPLFVVDSLCFVTQLGQRSTNDWNAKLVTWGTLLSSELMIRIKLVVWIENENSMKRNERWESWELCGPRTKIWNLKWFLTPGSSFKFQGSSFKDILGPRFKVQDTVYDPLNRILPLSTSCAWSAYTMTEVERTCNTKAKNIVVNAVLSTSTTQTFYR